MRLKEVDMTEQLIKWVSEQAVSKGDVEWEHVHPLSRVAAEFWLSAFVKEINRKEDECDNSGLGCPYESRSQCRGDKLRSVVRDFGLDSKEHRQPSADSDFMAANDEEGSK